MLLQTYFQSGEINNVGFACFLAILPKSDAAANRAHIAEQVFSKTIIIGVLGDSASKLIDAAASVGEANDEPCKAN
jgi:hypothetical protein